MKATICTQEWLLATLVTCPSALPLISCLTFFCLHSSMCTSASVDMRFYAAESTTAAPSPAAADDKTRLVRSVLLQDGAAEAQQTAPSPAAPSTSIVQGEGAPEPKPASPALAETVDSTPTSPPSPPPSSLPPTPQTSSKPSVPAPTKDSSERLLL